MNPIKLTSGSLTAVLALLSLSLIFTTASNLRLSHHPIPPARNQAQKNGAYTTLTRTTFGTGCIEASTCAWDAMAGSIGDAELDPLLWDDSKFTQRTV